MSAPTIAPVDLTKRPARLACGHTEAQHGDRTCASVKAIEARVAHAELPLWRRLTTRKPTGWGLLP